MSHRWRVSRGEGLTALFAAVYNVADVLSVPGSGLVTDHLAVDVVGAFALGLLLVFRQRHPIATTLLFVIGDWVFQAPSGLIAALLVLAQDGAVRGACCAGAFAAVAPVFTPWIVGRPYDTVLDGANSVARALIYVVAPIAVGGYLRKRNVRLVSLAEYTDRVEREQALLTERAQAEERTRIAGEVHDVVAHQVTHVLVYAGALKVGAHRGPDWVVQQADLIRRSGIEALEELRTVLGVLRPPGSEDATSPLKPPAVRALERLVDRTRATGAPVELTAERAGSVVPAEVRHTVYRIVQEALTNAVKYAPKAPVRVELHCAAGVYRVRVANEPPDEPPDEFPSGGNGLVGLRQRVQDLGGAFGAGPRVGGGFLVEATLPFSDLGVLHGPGAPGPASQERER
ncbi:sensor histidine kinase [Streptomyces griseocarneus]|nr:sensor histidine kinase [Streptomyces griseocarneus]